MKPCRTISIPGLIAAIALSVAMSACQSPTGDEASSAPEPATRQASISTGPPGIEELANATYGGTDKGEVTLVEGNWEGEPFVKGGASVPAAGLVRDFHLTGDLTGDGADEAVVLLWTNSGGTGIYSYIAAMGRDDSGTPVNLATVLLGDRIQVRSGEIVDGQIVFHVVQGGPGDAGCCPGQKMKRTFALEDDALTEVSAEDMGRQSIADLGGVEWVLTHFKWDEEVPGDTEITLVFDGDRIGGKSACNRYSGSVTEGEMPGDLTVNMPMAGTMMACPPPIDEIERRYLDALQNVTQYSFRAGKLALTWSKDDQWATMLFKGARSDIPM